MFAGLLNRAQATVDNAIGQILNRALIAMPFVIALGFGTAYGFLRLQREFDTETATLAMALGFAVLGLFGALIFGRRSGGAAETATSSDQPDLSAETSTSTDSPPSGIGAADKEVLIAALTTAGPIALPSIVRLLLKNLPLVAALVAVLFVMTRATPEDVSEATAGPDVA